MASISRQSLALYMSRKDMKDDLTIEFTCLSICMFESNTTLRLRIVSDGRKRSLPAMGIG